MREAARRAVGTLLRESGIGVALAALVVAFAIGAPRFATIANFSNILTQISINTVIAVGMTFVILTGGIDLSVGSVLALATIAAGKTMTESGLSPAVAVPAAAEDALEVPKFPLGRGACRESFTRNSLGHVCPPDRARPGARWCGDGVFQIRGGGSTSCGLHHLAATGRRGGANSAAAGAWGLRRDTL